MQWGEGSIDRNITLFFVWYRLYTCPEIWINPGWPTPNDIYLEWWPEIANNATSTEQLSAERVQSECADDRSQSRLYAAGFPPLFSVLGSERDRVDEYTEPSSARGIQNHGSSTKHFRRWISSWALRRSSGARWWWLTDDWRKDGPERGHDSFPGNLLATYQPSWANSVRTLLSRSSP